VYQSLYDGPLLCGFNVAIKGLNMSQKSKCSSVKILTSILCTTNRWYIEPDLFELLAAGAWTACRGACHLVYSSGFSPHRGDTSLW